MVAKKATVMAVVNQKGGTGKTTTTENLGVGLAMEGKKVLVVDTDPQAWEWCMVHLPFTWTDRLGICRFPCSSIADSKSRTIGRYAIRSHLDATVITNAILTLIFGAYFCFFARMKLPVYYDQNKISGVHDGIVRMNIPGLHFNNSNWPYIVKTGRVVMLVNMVLFPVLALFVGHINRELWIETEEYVMLVLLLGGLFVPTYIVGKKYE